MKTAPDFAGVDFCTALGEVYGIRSWKVDAYGRLRALHVPDAPAWRPGVNVATCCTDPTLPWISFTSLASYTFDFGKGGMVTTPTTKEESPAPRQPHETPDENCKCGFYAYTDPNRPESRPTAANEYVVGVVRGSGRTLIGTKGFRTEKAEIVALLDPTRGGRKKADWRQEQAAKIRRVYPDTPLLPSRAALLDFAPIEPTLPDPSTDEFWSLP